MTQIYKIVLMHGDPVYCTAEDVMKLVSGTNAGDRLVLIRGRFVNPATVATTQRYYGTDRESAVEMLDPVDADLDKLIAEARTKMLT